MKKERQSGIELMKIVAMFIIVISHVVQTYGSYHASLNIPNEYFININSVTKNINDLIVIFLRYLGALGNDLFFIASAWFLLKSQECKKQKVFQIILDTWFVSVIILIMFLLFKVDLSSKSIIKSFFPITLSTNWYITCYILFYLIHTKLNLIINSLNKKQLLSLNIILIIIYLFVPFINDTLFYNNRLVRFIVIYFIVAYAQKYMKIIISNLKINKRVFVSSLLLTIMLILVTNILGLKVSFLHNKVMHWEKGNNPLIILMAFSLFNLFRKKEFISKTINRWSSLTLLIYVIHENIIFRTYFRPYIFVFIKDNFGYKYIVLWILVISILLLLVSSFIGLIYTKTIQKFTKFLSGKFEKAYYNVNDKIINLFMKID